MKVIQEHSVVDRLPYWHFDEDTMIFSDGSFGAGFQLKGVDVSCASIEKVNRLANDFENLLNTAKEGYRLQVFYRLTDQVGSVLKAHEKLTESEAKGYEPIRESRLRFLSCLKENQTFCLPQVFIFIRSEPYRYKRQKLFEPNEKFKRVSEEDYRKAKSHFDRQVKQICSSLYHCGFEPERLSSKKWADLIFEYFNFSRAEKMTSPSIQRENQIFTPSLMNQLILSDVAVEKDAIQVGDVFFRTITLKTLPEGKSYASMMASFLKLPFYFWVTQNLSVHHQKKEIDKLQLQRRLTHSMASGSGQMSDLESESKLSHIEELLRELVDGSERIVSTDLNVLIWAEDKELLQEKTDEVLKGFKNLNQSEGLVENYAGMDAFIKSAPGICEGLRPKKVKSSNAAHLAPIYSYWQGNKRPICVLPNRDGVPVSIDPFAPELPNWNGLIFGGSGSGKSFVILQLMLMFYGQTPRPKIVWIDNGASSERFLEVLDGEFIDLNIRSKICLNLFDLDPGENEPTPSKIKLILAVLETILKETDSTGLPKRHKALLEAAIFRAYEETRNRTPTLSDLKRILLDHPSVDMKSYGEILFSWTGNTAYGRMLDAQTNVELSKDIITVETKGLDDYPDLQNVFLLLFTDFIKSAAAKEPTQPYLLILDEAWKLFQTPSGLAFTLEAYRTFRKFNAGIWCISQNYKDFLFNQDIKNAVFPNTTSILILKQRGIDWGDFQETLAVNETELEAIKSLKLVKGEFSELFYIQDEGRAVLRVMPDPLSYLICTTDPADKARIQKMAEEYPGCEKMKILLKLINQKTKTEAA